MRLNTRPCESDDCPHDVTWPSGRRGAPPKYCSPQCKSRQDSRRARARIYADPERHEAWKRGQAVASKSRTAKRAAERPTRVCNYCPQPVSSPHPQTKTCGSEECRRLHRNARMSEYCRSKTEEFAARGGSYRGQWDREVYGDGKQRAGGGDTIRRVALGNRDNWICGICKKPIEPHLRHPDLESGSIDHIIPLGPKFKGTHTWDNVQIAHYLCDIRKKDRLNWTPEEGNHERT